MTKDNFSSQAELYANFRPHYPEDLYQFIFNQTSSFNTAWDCGTGNGQVAKVLSEVFNKVYATDISKEQLKQAYPKENIAYSIGSAEASGLTSQVDLITVAQAIHWFDIKKFVSEAKRVSRNGALLCYWGYGLIQVDEEIDLIINDFYKNTINSYWDPERKLIDEHYRSIKLPLKNEQAGYFQYRKCWSLEHFIGYLTSWSSVQRFININKYNPVEALQGKLESLWKDEYEVTFPIFLKSGNL